MLFAMSTWLPRNLPMLPLLTEVTTSVRTSPVSLLTRASTGVFFVF